MPYVSPLPPNTPIIDDDNANQFIDPVVDGHRRYCALTPRDYQKYPVGGTGFAAIRTFQTYTKAQLLELIRQRDEMRSGLRYRLDQMQIPVKDQDGLPYCHDDKTEVLTERGWVRWTDYNWQDSLGTRNPVTGHLEFQQPTAKHIFEYNGELVHSTNRRLDFGVTPNHRMLVRKWDESKRQLSDQYSFQLAGELGWYVELPHATTGYQGIELDSVTIPGDRKYTGDDFVAMLALIVSDGYAGGDMSSKTENMVSFASFKPSRRQKVAELAHRIGFREQPSREGVWSRRDAGALARWVRANCYTGRPHRDATKQVPTIIKCLSERQIRLFLDFFGDKTDNSAEGEGRCFVSSSRRMIDDLQELLLRIGRRGTIVDVAAGESVYRATGQVIRSGPCYRLLEASTTRLCLERKKHIERDSYKGPVFCATVPNGTLVTRRNGSVLISGNCWIYSAVHTMEVMFGIQGDGYVPLSADYAGALITGGVSRGGYGAEAIEFLSRYGTCRERDWPLHRIALKNRTKKADEIAAYNRITDWGELPSGNLDQLAAAVINNFPVTIGLPWWRHQVTIIDLVVLEREVIGFVFNNSWGRRWGDNGRGVLVPSKARGDMFYPISVSPRPVDLLQST